MRQFYVNGTVGLQYAMLFLKGYSAGFFLGILKNF